MGSTKKDEGTKTSDFGSPGRFNHDSSEFYNSRLYEGLGNGDTHVEYYENKIPANKLDKIFCKSSENMEELPDSSVHLMVTSPPYNVGKQYDKSMNLEEYREFLSRVWKEVYRVLVPGGRTCINVANLGRKPYIPLSSFILEDMLKLGFLMRGEVIWDKGATASPSMAWGSWLSAKNATLRDVHEYILIFSKSTFTRLDGGSKKSTITNDEFMEFTKSMWHLGAESARKIGHPAPFPVELPARCIKLYTFEGDVVLDPFIGSGTTAIAALNLKRRFVGYDVDEKYVELANKRIESIKNQRALIDEASFADL